MKTLLQQLDECPPFLCYIAAHRGKPVRPSREELARAARMSPRTFSRIVNKTSWANITVEDAQALSLACNVDLINSSPVILWVAQELSSPEPFPQLNQRGAPRKLMLKRLNLLAAKAVMSK